MSLGIHLVANLASHASGTEASGQSVNGDVAVDVVVIPGHLADHEGSDAREEAADESKDPLVLVHLAGGPSKTAWEAIGSKAA